jgi:hypothetical protein
MSLRSLRIPGKRLGLGTFVNSDVDAKRMIVYTSNFNFTIGNHNRTMTQGVTRMAEIQCALIGAGNVDDKGSASLNYTLSTVDGGTIIVHVRPWNASAASSNNRATECSFWIVGTPDPNRVIL